MGPGSISGELYQNLRCVLGGFLVIPCDIHRAKLTQQRITMPSPRHAKGEEPHNRKCV